ncbi:hypothetical protein [Rhodococcus opacus]|uniref:hypothetical protein n=1 Tax=Rhodococcus opacus TaxID=37919 RepID=UPI0003120FBB|nr:hypothetical protein [Rhodococcus opacus]UNN04988.1 hypothetical protein MOO23_39150 [Rhodococcus opacus]
MTDPGGGGHVWAPVHRWGIAVDDGRLTFVYTEDLTVDPSFHGPIPERDRDGAVAHTRPAPGRLTAAHRRPRAGPAPRCRDAGCSCGGEEPRAIRGSRWLPVFG